MSDVTVTREKNPFSSYCGAGEGRHRLEKTKPFSIKIKSGNTTTVVTLCRDHMEELVREIATAFTEEDS